MRTRLVLFLLGVLALHGQVSLAGRIAIESNGFTVGGAPVFLNGINTPWHRWNEFGGAYDHDWWDAEFRRLKEAHVNCVRIWVHCDGRRSPVTREDGVVLGVPEGFWAHMDDLFALASKHELYVMPALWSFDMTRRGGRYKVLLADPAKVQSYIDSFLVPLVERYDGHPCLLAWEICNEPEWMSENAGVPLPEVIRMHAMLAAAIHEHSSSYVTTGSACVKWNGNCASCVGNWWSDASLKEHHPTGDPRAFLDFYQVHYYGWQDPWFGTPFDMTVAEYGVPDDRPVIIGEMPARGGPNRHVQLYRNGFDGGFAWTSNGIDRNGRLEDIGPALLEFSRLYPDLVRPPAATAGDGTTRTTQP
jgi:hypothetical protein